jgi:hypothetical protein
MTPDSANDPSGLDPHVPTAVDPVDERLSAALDGSADPEAAAGEHAEESNEDRERAASLAAARDLLAIPPPPIDDLARRRLMRAALDAWPAPRRRDHRWSSMVGIAAAVLGFVVVAGSLIVALNHQSSSKSKGSGAALASGTTAADRLSGTTPDLREVSDPAVLRRRVEAALDAPRSPFGQGETAQPTSAPSADSAAGAHCMSSVRLPAGATASVLGNATFHGVPAVIVVGREGPRVLIYVLANDNCRLLTSQFLRR